MFRAMRKTKDRLSDEECIKILKTAPRGVMALIGDGGYPYNVPMNFVYEDGKLYLHSVKEGYKIDAIRSNDKVSFCVVDNGIKPESEWAFWFKSVIIFGRIRIIDDTDTAAKKLRLLGRKYFPTEAYIEGEMKRGFDQVYCLELTIENMTGKKVHEA